MTTNQETQSRPGKLGIYHPRKDGNGAAVQLDLRLNQGDEKTYDCFFLNMANQNGTQTVGGRRVASFDWEDKAVVKLGFPDICELLAVCEGGKDTVGNGKGGLFHRSGDGNTVIGFSRSTEAPGYNLSLSRKRSDGEQQFRSHIFLTEPEVVGLRSILQVSLFFLSFHQDFGMTGRRYGVAATAV